MDIYELCEFFTNYANYIGSEEVFCIKRKVCVCRCKTPPELRKANTEHVLLKHRLM
jgi:hypothetical protein